MGKELQSLPLSEFRLPQTPTLRQAYTLAKDQQELIIARGMAHHVNIRYNMTSGNSFTVSQANQTVNSLIDTTFPLPPPIDPDHPQLVFSNKPLPLNLFGQTLLATDPSLCLQDFLIYTYPAQNQPASINKKTAFSWMSKRLSTITAQGILPESEVAKIAVLASFYYIAADLSNHRAADFLSVATRSDSFLDHDSARAFPEKSLTPSLRELRNVQNYAARVLTRLEEASASAYLSDEEAMLLADIALVNGTAAVLQSKSAEIFNTQVTSPLIRLITENKWEEAINARNFLLTYFPHFFPPWRVDQSYRPAHAHLYFNLLAKDLAGSRPPIANTEIPPVYQQFLLPHAHQRRLLQKPETEADSTQESVTFANILLENLNIQLEDQFKKSGYVNLRDYARTLPKPLRLILLGLAGPVRLNSDGNPLIDTRYYDPQQLLKREAITQEDFSKYFFYLVASAVTSSSTFNTIPEVDFSEALRKSYQQLSEQFPEDTTATLFEYLKAILSAHLQKTASKDTDSVRQFLAGFK